MGAGFLAGGAPQTPNGWTWELPFILQQVGNNFWPKAWDVSSLRPTTGTTMYVDPVSGDDSDGLTWATAWKSIQFAVTRPGVGTVYIKPGTYGYATADGGWQGSIGTAKALVCDSGTAILTPRLLHSYSAVATHYEAAATTAITSVMDTSILNGDGSYTKYTLAANAAGVEATPGTFFWAANVLYVRTLDSRAPDSSIYALRTGSNGMNVSLAGGDVRYMENCKLLFCSDRMVRIFNSADTTLSHFYFKNCTFSHQQSSPVQYDLFDIDGAIETICQGCVCEYGPLDGFNYHQTPFSGIPQAIEINCIGRYCGLTGATNNGSSTHEGAPVVRIMGEYHHSYGANIGDVGGAKIWNMGTESHHSLTATAERNAGFLVADGGPTIMWCDSCYSHDNLIDLCAIEGETIYYRNLRGPGVQDGDGTGVFGTY